MLLGRAGGGYRFTHVDNGGDRSVTFDFSDELLDEAQRASGIKRGDPANLSAVSIPASPHTAAATVLALQALNVNDADIWEELALLIATTVVVSAAQLNAAPERLSYSARRRIWGRVSLQSDVFCRVQDITYTIPSAVRQVRLLQFTDQMLISRPARSRQNSSPSGRTDRTRRHACSSRIPART
jgi:hypothetical protein